MAKDYIEKRETGYYVIGSRIPLDTIVIAFLTASPLKASSNRSPHSRWNKSMANSLLSGQPSHRG